MEFDKSIFGDGIKIYNKGGAQANVPLYDYTVPSRNANLSAGYESNAFQVNSGLPDSLFYWLIGKDSPYNQTSFVYRTGTSGNYTFELINSEKNNNNIPIVLWGMYTKINPTSYDIDIENGSNLNTSVNNAYVVFNTSTLGNLNTSQTPMWEQTFGHSSSVYANGVYSSLPFIIDFNYNNFILKILVSGGTSGLTDLANYNNNSTNYIKVIAVQLYTGDVSTDYDRVTTNVPRTDENGNIVGYTNTASFCPVTDFDYFIPDIYKRNSLYAYDKYRIIGQHGTNIQKILFNGASVVTSLTNAIPYFYMDEEHWEFADNSYRLIKHGDNIYNEDDFNYIRKLVAWLGFWFTDGGRYVDTSHAYAIERTSTKLGDDANTYSDIYMIPDKVYQAEIKDGVTTGNFTELRIAKDNEQSKWGKDWREKNGYEGRDTINPTDESSRSSRLTYSSALTSFGKIYLCTKENIDALASALKTLVTDEQNPYDPTLFYGQNPVDCIINIKEYPFDISSCIEYTSFAVEPMYLGRWTPVRDPLDSQYQKYFARACNIKSASEPFSYITISIPAHYKDLGYPFMDYEPYSSYHLYLPFCGTVKIPSELAIESRIEVLYFADVLSGACIAHIYINYKYYCSVQGQLSVDVPVSGYQLSNYARDMLNATYAQKQAYAAVASDVGRIISSAGSAGLTLGISDKRAWGNSAPSIFPNMSAGNLTKLGGLTMGLGSAIQAGADMWSKYETIKYNKTLLDHSAPAPVKSSLGGGIINWESPYFVEMLVQRPVFMEGYDAEAFNATMGRACYLADTLGNHSGGYVEAINCKLSGFPATQTEKVELAKLLADGVFL